MTSQRYNEYRELIRSGKSIEASRLAEFEYLEGNRNNPFWLTRQAAALSRPGNYEQALSIGMQALSLNHSNPYSNLVVADALFGLKRFTEALQYYEEAAEETKIVSYRQKGILSCLLELKEWEQILQLVVKWEMDQETGFRWRVKALAAQNRLEEAIEACHEWLKILPDNPQGLWELTELEIRRDGLEPVLLRMERIAKIPSRPPVYKEIYASLCRRAGKPELAIKQYEHLSRGKSDPKILRKLAFALPKSGKHMEAIPIMEELLKLNPADIYIHSSYTAACKKVKDLDRALNFYEKLLELHPEEKKLYGRIRKIRNVLGAKE